MTPQLHPNPAPEGLSGPNKVSKVILDYAASIQGAQNEDDLLVLNAGLARDISGADRCSIWLIDEQKGELWTKVAHGVDRLRIPLGTGLVGACVQQNETVLVNDVSSDSRFHGRVDRESGYVTNSVLVLPIRGVGKRVIGALQVLNKPGGFTADDVELLHLAAVYSAAALEGQRLRREAEEARLVYQELAIARDVQQQMFPQQFPKLANLECAAFCRPAKSVGGDYYDFVELPDDVLAFTLGDVSGKGIVAALLMSSIQASLRALLSKAWTSSAALFEEFNRSIYRCTVRGRYSTLIFGSLDMAERRLTYVNAGHVPPMLRRRNGEIVRLEVGGLPIGLLANIKFNQGEILLEQGDVLLCLSDGITEALNSVGDMWDESEIEKLLSESGELPCHDLVQRIAQATDDFSAGAEQSDDMTIVALRQL
jgi:sigma-B regulation protein RsbU (phosphoserine phosphatase)